MINYENNWKQIDILNIFKTYKELKNEKIIIDEQLILNLLIDKIKNVISTKSSEYNISNRGILVNLKPTISILEIVQSNKNNANHTNNLPK